MLCDTCIKIFSGTSPTKVSRAERRDAFEPHQRTIADLRHSYLADCHICAILRRLLPSGPLAEIERLVTESGTTGAVTQFNLGAQEGDDNVNYDLRFIVKIPLDGYIARRAAFEVVLFDDFKGVNTEMLSESTGSDSSLNTARKWVHECTTEHEACNRHTDQKFLPTRLLDVGQSGTNKIRLCISAEEGVTEPYATLSHCWGDAVFLRLTKTTEDSLRRGIKFEDLPKTFQDAIVVCRRIGIKYLWIDSLCIFQDSRIDWRAESSIMGRIYRGGFCNIAATGAQDSDEGLFFDRNGLSVSAATVETQWTDWPMEKPSRRSSSRSTGTLSRSSTSLSSKSVERKNGRYLVYQKDGIWIELNSAKLLRRAWVLQERYMARRVLHFHKKELLWECSSLSASERFPKGLSHPSMKHNPFGAFRTRDFFWLEAERNDHGWRRLVDIYSQCQLTKDEDKLVALSGIVKEIQLKRPDSKYYAGLWSTSLFEDLLWRVRQPKKPKTWRAPSWSWASLDGIISWPKPFHHDWKLAQHPTTVLSVHLTHPSSDPTGEVTSGSIHLHGPLLTLTIQLPHEPITNATEIPIFINNK